MSCGRYETKKLVTVEFFTQSIFEFCKILRKYFYISLIFDGLWDLNVITKRLELLKKLKDVFSGEYPQKRILATVLHSIYRILISPVEKTCVNKLLVLTMSWVRENSNIFIVVFLNDIANEKNRWFFNYLI